MAHSGIERLGMLAHTILEAEGGGSPRPKTDPRPNLADASHRPFWPSGSSQQFSLPGGHYQTLFKIVALFKNT